MHAVYTGKDIHELEAIYAYTYTHTFVLSHLYVSQTCNAKNSHIYIYLPRKPLSFPHKHGL